MDGFALPLAGLGRNAEDIDLRSLDRAIGRHAVDDARHPSIEYDLGFRRDRDPLGRTPDDEFIDFGEGARAERGPAMIDMVEDEVGRPFERRAFGGDVGRRAGIADVAGVRLRVEVISVAAQREEGNARRSLRCRRR